MLKTAKKYLQPVQRSVLEGNLTVSNLHRMQSELAALIDPERDSIAIYSCENAASLIKLQIGISSGKTENFF